MAAFTGQTIASTYGQILKTTAAGFSATPTIIQDGLANNSCLRLSSAALESTGTLACTGDFTVGSSVFTVNSTNGNTAVGGTLSCVGNFAVDTTKFQVLAASGNTTVAGTLNVSGAATLTGGLGVTGATTINGQLGATSIQNTPIGSVTPATGSFTTGEFTQVDVKAAGQLRLQDTTGGEYVGFKAPSTVPTSYAVTLPSAQGGVGSTLINDGSGVLSWQIPGGGGGGSQISAGDSSFSVSDTGSGTINAVIDGFTRSTFTTGEYHISTKLRANELDNTPIGVTTPAAGNFNQVNIKSRNELRFEDTTGGDYVGIRAPSAVGTSYTISLPTAQGGVGSSLVNDGAGNLTWQVAGGGGGSSISAGDSSVSVIDSGSGTISHVIDGVTKLSLNSTTLANTGNITNTGTLDTTGSLSVGINSIPPKFVVDGATGDVTTTARTTLVLTTEKVADLSGATGTVVHNLVSATIFNHVSMNDNFTANFTNAPTTNSRSLVATLILNQTATARFPTTIQLNGVTQTVNWANNIIPTGTANKKEIVSFTFIRNSSGGTTCLGNYISYG